MKVIAEKISSTQVQLAEELINIELFPGMTGYVMRIGTHMLDTDTKAIVTCLRENTDVFAFSSTALTWADTEIAMHSLDMDTTAKPVK